MVTGNAQKAYRRALKKRRSATGTGFIVGLVLGALLGATTLVIFSIGGLAALLTYATYSEEVTRQRNIVYPHGDAPDSDF
jgi:Mg/Co/Ni transporter MgtE